MVFPNSYFRYRRTVRAVLKFAVERSRGTSIQPTKKKGITLSHRDYALFLFLPIQVNFKVAFDTRHVCW